MTIDRWRVDALSRWTQDCEASTIFERCICKYCSSIAFPYSVPRFLLWAVRIDWLETRGNPAFGGNSEASVGNRRE